MRYIFILIFLLAICVASTIGQQRDILDRCAKLFGSPVDHNRHFYEVDRYFILHVEFEGSQLIRISVEPKYFHEETHPEWTEPPDWPLMSKSQVEQLMSKIAEIRDYGFLIQRGAIAVVTNNTRWIHDKYALANLELGGVGDSFRVLRFNYFFRMSGRIIGKRFINGGTVWIKNRGQLRKLVVSTRDYRKLKLGHQKGISVACFNFNEGEC